MIIVSTTINKPTVATLKFAEQARRKNWLFLMVGDTKTPHDEYKKLEEENSNFEYLDPETQEREYKELSDCIGWKTIQRRNVGFAHAYKIGEKIVASVDDDNIPYDNWGENIFVNQEIDLDLWNNSNLAFDPYSVTNNSHIWQRGYPIDLVRSRTNNIYQGKVKRKVLIQNDLVDGDSDIDATCRLLQKPIVKFNKIDPFSSSQYTPFNSQNTFLSRDVFPHYSCWPGVGRFDDILGGYYVQAKLNINPIFCSSTVYQDRNEQDLIKNLSDELLGYKFAKEFLATDCSLESATWIPKQTLDFINVYEKTLNKYM